MTFPRRLGHVLVLDGLKDGVTSLERSSVPVASHVRRVEQKEAAGSNGAEERLEEMPGRMRNVLDYCGGQCSIEAAESRDLLELAVAACRDDSDPLALHQLDVAVERTPVAGVAVARGDVVAEASKSEGERPEPGAHLEHPPAVEAPRLQRLQSRTTRTTFIRR
jgi:hypothetical protein